MGVLSRIGIGCCGLYRGTKFSIAIAAAFLATIFSSLSHADEFQTFGGLTLPGTDVSAVNSISSNGTVIVGTSSSSSIVYSEAFKWSQAAGLSSLGTGNTFALAVDSDGSTIVGQGDGLSGYSYEPFRWTQSGGIVALGVLPGTNRGTAFGVNGDGSIVVGSTVATREQAFRWTQATGMQSLGTLSGGTGSRATAISDDGLVCPSSDNLRQMAV